MELKFQNQVLELICFRLWLEATREEIHPGDVVWFEPNEKHWHGATAANGMTHIAIQENLNGKVVEWMEKVSDQQYTASIK